MRSSRYRTQVSEHCLFAINVPLESNIEPFQNLQRIVVGDAYSTSVNVRLSCADARDSAHHAHNPRALARPLTDKYRAIVTFAHCIALALYLPWAI